MTATPRVTAEEFARGLRAISKAATTSAEGIQRLAVAMQRLGHRMPKRGRRRLVVTMSDGVTREVWQ